MLNLAMNNDNNLQLIFRQKPFTSKYTAAWILKQMKWSRWPRKLFHCNSEKVSIHIIIVLFEPNHLHCCFDSGGVHSWISTLMREWTSSGTPTCKMPAVTSSIHTIGATSATSRNSSISSQLYKTMRWNRRLSTLFDMRFYFSLFCKQGNMIYSYQV